MYFVCTHLHGDDDVTARKIEKYFEKVNAKFNLTSMEPWRRDVSTQSDVNADVNEESK